MQLPLFDFASSKSVREILRRESKREPKNPKDDDEKRKRGKLRRGISGSRL